ncbi:MAG: CoA pyrophosphatase [Emergencia sp.]|nr:CoA pyrophosphatase [Emergencia sp.]
MNLTLSDIKKTFAEREPAPIGEHRFFSVLVPFVEKDGELYILYEVRAKAMASQPGEICFPGGHVEAGESPRDCALRETFEEIGIPAEKISLMGAGNILYGYANYTLYTYLGAVDYETYCSAKLQKDEVDEIFLVRLSDFEKHPPKVFSEKVYTEIDKDFPYEEVGIGRDYAWRVGRWDIPIYQIDGRVIWGLTARITGDIIKTVRETCFYR